MEAENVLTLTELLETHFYNLEYLISAAYGQCNINRETTGYNPYGLRDIFAKIALNHKTSMNCPLNIEQQLPKKYPETEQNGQIDRGISIQGCLNEDVLIGIYLGCQYFVNNAKDFYIENGTRYATNISCTLNGTRQNRQAVCCLDDDSSNFSAIIYGFLPECRRFRLSIGSHPRYRLPFIQLYPNNFEFEIKDINWNKGKHDLDVHVNGDEDNPVMKDLLTIGRSITKYCQVQVTK